ncbi:MAG: hypothetical protein RRA92_04150 [Gemmatimonadota bacterium]|nr:hypothetical protein [Gemmatimonadota bacterium]
MREDAPPVRPTTDPDADRRPPLPRPLDAGRALDIYVRGKGRGWSQDRKLAAAPPRPVAPRPAGSAAPPAARGAPVPVPQRLRFHRGASRWRDVLPPSAAPRPGRDTD